MPYQYCEFNSGSASLAGEFSSNGLYGEAMAALIALFSAPHRSRPLELGIDEPSSDRGMQASWRLFRISH
jgi:hypothetical protein